MVVGPSGMLCLFFVGRGGGASMEVLVTNGGAGVKRTNASG